MTPEARWQATIDVLDEALGNGFGAGDLRIETVMKSWGRRNRYAGSGDRAAIRDHLYEILRKMRSCAALGGGQTGRALVIGALRERGIDPREVFNGQGHAPGPLTAEEEQPPAEWLTLPEAVRWDQPDWLMPLLVDSLADEAEGYAMALRSRAPVFVRVNAQRGTVEEARAALATAGISAVPHSLAPFALEITEGARKLAQSEPYLRGMVELQDVASQAVTHAVKPLPENKILDFCAGGGGKALALAALTGQPVFAHDVNVGRMKDLPARAHRAGARIPLLSSYEEVSANAPYDMIFCDAPCSGSGSWRRDPAGKWALTSERLSELVETQSSILAKAAALVVPGGRLCYCTCSVLSCENDAQVSGFVDKNSEFMLEFSARFLPRHGGDGFYIASLRKRPH